MTSSDCRQSVLLAPTALTQPQAVSALPWLPMLLLRLTRPRLMPSPAQGGMVRLAQDDSAARDQQQLRDAVIDRAAYKLLQALRLQPRAAAP